MICRHCRSPVDLPFIDLGSAPPSNGYLTAERLRAPERWFPLRVLVCTRCWLVQTEDVAGATELFDDEYAYFSSVSRTWLAHAERYVADMVERFSLNEESHVVEVAANDGYLLQYVEARGIPNTGIEPTASTAAAARARGLRIVQDFFGTALAESLLRAAKPGAADLVVANNVLAHVPDINDFVAGFARLLKPAGVATFEFPHLLRLVEGNQFDTIYHEHYSYLSLTAVDGVFAANGLTVFDVEEHPTHGGSLRVFAQRAETSPHPRADAVGQMLRRERDAGMQTAAYYSGFQRKAERVKDDFLAFLLAAKGEGARVAAYGAAAKGNTLMNFAGVRSDLIAFVGDRNPSKQGKFMPGSRIPIVSEARITAERPAYLVLFPWNLRAELSEQLAYTKDWGARCVVAVPSLIVI